MPEAAPALPLPIAALLRRARNAKSAKERHDAALGGWEASVRLAVALAPPATPEARARLALPSLADWTRAAPLDDRALLPGEALLSAARLLREEGRGDAVTARALVDPLPAYRDRVRADGAAARDAAFFEDAAARLSAGLAAAWEAGVFWPAGARLLFVDAVEIDASGRRRARVLDLSGANPFVLDPRGTTDLPQGALPRRLYARAGARWTGLHPWVLYDDDGLRERVLLFNGRRRAAEAIDLVGGETLRGRALEAQFPGVEAEYDALFSRSGSGSGGGGAGSGSGAGAMEEADPSRFGDYRLLSVLGSGGMGVVHLARQEGLGREVALKMLPPHAIKDDVARRRFEREVAALSRCDHPHVVKILASGEHGGAPYYAMELVRGKELGAHAAALPPAERALRLAPLFRDAARGVAHLHEAGILHRDLKPSNIMVTDEGARVVVMDLGLAALEDASASLTREGAGLLGTLRYTAPEQLSRGLIETDRRADVYSLGATFYEAICGRPLHDGATEARLTEQLLHEEPPRPESVDPRVPRDLSLVLRTAVERDRRRRYASAGALADDLDALLEGRPVSARAPTLGYLAWLFVRRHKAACAAAAAALAVAAASVVLYVRGLEESRRAEAAARARAEASERRALAASAEAEDLLRFMLGDVQEKLAPLGKTSLLEAVALRARDHYEAMDPSTLGPGERLRRATATGWIARILSARGDDARARADLGRAIEQQVALVDDPVVGPEARLAATKALLDLAYHELDHGRPYPALDAARRAEALTGPVAAAKGAPDLAILSHCDALCAIATALSSLDDPDAALACAERARAALEALIAARGATPDVEDRLAAAQFACGDALVRFPSRAAEAADRIRADIAISERLLRTKGADLRSQRGLGQSYRILCLALEILGDDEGALAAARRALALVEPVIAADPDDLTSAILYWQVRAHIGFATARTDPEATSAEVTRALEGLRAVRERSEGALLGAAPEFQIGVRLAHLENKRGRTREVDALLERYMPMIQAAAAMPDAKWPAFAILIGAQTERTYIMRQRRRFAEAIESAKGALAAVEAAEARFPGKAELTQRRGSTCDVVAGAFEAAGRWAEAAAAQDGSTGARLALLALEPASATRTADVARSRSRSGIYHLNAKEPARAVEELQGAEEAWAKLDRDPAGRDDPRVEGADCAVTRGIALVGLERHAEAEAAFRSAADALEAAAQRGPATAALLEKLWKARRGRAKALGKLGGRAPEEAALARAAAEAAERLAELAPRWADAHRAAMLSHLDLADIALRDGALEESERRLAACVEEAARTAALRPLSPKEGEVRAGAERRLAEMRAKRAAAGEAPAGATGTARTRP